MFLFPTESSTEPSLIREVGGCSRQGLFGDAEAVPEELRLGIMRVEEISKQPQKNVEKLEGLSGRLQTGAMNFRMVPVAQLFNRFPAQVREMARKVGKRTRLVINGADRRGHHMP